MVPSVIDPSCLEHDQVDMSLTTKMSESKNVTNTCKSRRRVSLTNADCGQRVGEDSAVRINLRKRAVDDERQGVVLASYNSAFLSGLFADIANATSPTEQDTPISTHDSMPNKRSRISMTHSISRCGRSFANLTAGVEMEQSPSSTILPSSPDESCEISRHNSLTYQLHCVSSASSNESEDQCSLVFPHLPASISDNSCGSTLTRNNTGRQTPDSEIPSKDCYGWFVEMEDDEDFHESPVNAYKTTTHGGLAFQAPTAPKAVNHDADVEWAKAADTVDDVLGDFF